MMNGCRQGPPQPHPPGRLRRRHPQVHIRTDLKHLPHLERYSVLGGSSHVFRRQGKWEFDCGVHFVGDCGPGGQVPTLLHGLGIDDRIEWLPMESTGFNTTVAPGLELKMPFGWDNYLTNLVEAFPEDARGLRRFIGVMRKVGEAFDRSSHRPPSASSPRCCEQPAGLRPTCSCPTSR